MTSLRWTAVKIFFLVLFLLGTIAPDLWWGLHAIAFLPDPVKIAILGIASVIMFVPVDRVPVIADTFLRQSVLPLHITTYFQFGAISFIAGFLFYQFPIPIDIYGDAEIFFSAYGEQTTSAPGQISDYIFSLNVFHPKTGERTIYGAVVLLSYKLGVTHNVLFRILGSMSGAAFIFIWLTLIRHIAKDRGMQICLSIMGISAPFLVLFMGHTEVYAPVIPAITAYFLFLIIYFKQHDKRYLALTALSLLLCLKLHSTSILLIPSFLIAIAMQSSISKRVRINWKNISLWVLLPVYAIGIVLYVFVLKDYKDPRYFTESFLTFERLFLPLLSPPPPLDRYNLFSVNHVFDYFNMVLLWSPVALFMICAAVLSRIKINWNSPEILLTGVTLLLYVPLFFMINPLLGMQFDWDLFSIPAPIFLILTSLVVSQTRNEGTTKKILLTTIALSILTVPIFYVNASHNPLSHRLESLGVRTFNTYWIRSAKSIEIAIDMLKDDKPLTKDRHLHVLSKLKPNAIKGNDVEYAVLLLNAGQFYSRALNDQKTALKYYEEAAAYSPELRAIYVRSLESYFILGEYKKAYFTSLEVIKLTPNQPTSHRMAIHCALEAELFKKAETHCRDYLNNWPSDQTVIDVYRELQEGVNLTNIKRYFSSK